MRLYCLASISLIPPDENYVEPTPYDEGADELYIPFTGYSSHVFPENMISDYQLTEICIGWKQFADDVKKSFAISLYQTNSGEPRFFNSVARYFTMLRSFATITYMDKNNGCFDLCLATAKFPCMEREQLINYNLKIRAFCIKNTKKINNAPLPSVLTLEEELAYNNYAKQINNFYNKHPNITPENFRMEILQRFGPLKLPNQSIEKVLKQKLTDFQLSVNLLCDPITGSYKNVTPNFYNKISKQSKASRIYQQVESLLYLKESTWDATTFRHLLMMDKFRDCRSLNWKNIALNNKLNFAAFNFSNLTQIDFAKIDLGKDMEFWHKLAGNNNFVNVIFISLTDCGITALDEEFFKHLPTGLDVLKINYNDIRFISKSISKLSQLIILELNNNKNLPDEGLPWDSLPSTIKHLKLENTNVTKIPNEVEKLVLLRVLNVSSPKLNNMNLTTFCSYRISQIAFDKFKFTDTNELLLNNLKIDELMIPILKFVKLSQYELKYLRLINNDLKYFNIDDFNYYHLCELTISQNRLKKFSWKLIPTSIQKLDLSYNRIETITEKEEKIDFSLFKELKEISFKANVIKFLPEGFENLPKLKKLDLRFNKLCHDISRKTDVFCDDEKVSQNLVNVILWNRIPKNIEYLDLTANNPEIVLLEGNETDFSTFLHLKEILLKYNDISSLPKGFENLPALQKLNLNNNNFGKDGLSLTEVLWHRLPKSLFTLKLDCNEISLIPCCFKNFKFRRLDVCKTNLRYICPYLHTNIQKSSRNFLYFDVTGNPQLELSFMPNTIYPLPKADIQPITRQPSRNANLPVTTHDKQKKEYFLNEIGTILIVCQINLDKSFTIKYLNLLNRNENIIKKREYILPKNLENLNSHIFPKKIHLNNAQIFATGIDLGTSRCCAAVNRQNGIETVALDNQGQRQLPSYVAFDERTEKCGQVVINRLQHHAQSTVFDIKRLLGKRFIDVKIDVNWPFKIDTFNYIASNESVEQPLENENFVKIDTPNGTILKYPEEISAVLLKHIKLKAEEFQGKTLTDAVITIPAAFNEKQIQATYDAAILAGWKTIHFLYEPVAAAFAYFINRPIPSISTTVLLFDLGGGTMDVCIFKIKNTKLKIISRSGDPNIGGRDFDNLLIQYFENKMLKNYSVKVKDSKRYKRMQKCQYIKENLSTMLEDSFDVDDIDSSIDANIVITRNEFEEMSLLLLHQIRINIEKALEKVKPNQVNRVLQVGGGCRMPMIKKLLKDMLPGSEQCCEKNPDEVVAIGAAYYAYYLNQNDKSNCSII